MEMANDKYLQTFVEEPDFMGKPVFEGNVDFEVHGVKELLENVIATATPFYGNELEYYIVRNGKREQCFFNFVCHPIQEEGDSVTGTIVVANEITEQVLARKRVEESEQRLRNLVEKAPSPICILKGEKMILEVANEPVFRIWNVGKEVIGRPFLDIIPEMKNQPFMGWLLKVYRNGITHYGSEEPAYFFREDGSKETIYFNFVYQPYREKDGTITGLMVLATDITEQVMARKKIEESEAQFRQLINLMPGKIACSDATGKVNYYNQAWIDYTGLPVEQLLNQGWMQAIHPEDLPKLIERRAQSLNTGNILEMEFRVLNKHDEYKWHKTSEDAVRDESGKVARWISVTTEIQKLKDEEILRDNFISMASHELKTPVTTIKAYGQIAQMMLQKNGDAPTLGIINKMSNQIDKLNRLITDLLDFTKVRNGFLMYNKAFFSFNDFINGIVEDMQSTSLTHTIENHAGENAQVFGDMEKLGQVIINLISNAIKYSPTASKILVISRLHENGVELCIQDFGIGIPADKYQRVFEQFYRVSGESQATFSGMGIGLYISAEIIKGHKGRIWVESSTSQGSVFCIWLPLDQWDI